MERIGEKLEACRPFQSQIKKMNPRAKKMMSCFLAGLVVQSMIACFVDIPIECVSVGDITETKTFTAGSQFGEESEGNSIYVTITATVECHVSDAQSWYSVTAAEAALFDASDVMDGHVGTRIDSVNCTDDAWAIYVDEDNDDTVVLEEADVYEKDCGYSEPDPLSQNCKGVRPGAYPPTA